MLLQLGQLWRGQRKRPDIEAIGETIAIHCITLKRFLVSLNGAHVKIVWRPQLV